VFTEKNALFVAIFYKKQDNFLKNAINSFPAPQKSI